MSPAFLASLVPAVLLALVLWALIGLAILVTAAWLAAETGDRGPRLVFLGIAVWCWCVLIAARRLCLRLWRDHGADPGQAAHAAGQPSRETVAGLARNAASAASAAAAAACTSGAWRGAAGVAEQFAAEVHRTDFAGDPEGALRHLASTLRQGADQVARALD